jgi:hypothetical protein
MNRITAELSPLRNPSFHSVVELAGMNQAHEEVADQAPRRIVKAKEFFR